MTQELSRTGIPASTYRSSLVKFSVNSLLKPDNTSAPSNSSTQSYETPSMDDSDSPSTAAKGPVKRKATRALLSVKADDGYNNGHDAQGARSLQNKELA
ncbi:hypothetical protein FPOA_04866 [Fusarium poae]|uniref:Uncharacterized protein n=1 Tax=Fusarium poae TaxID=36050 RepID=A0A1B8AVB6_FUSPO|nr:hypothetical protein FPOA_04866 [Fusarium poae]